jgi:hypothetical protein
MVPRRCRRTDGPAPPSCGTSCRTDRSCGMSEFRFDPPLTLKNRAVVRSLDDAAAIVRTYKHSRRPVLQDSVLHRLQSASSEVQQRNAADAFRSWIEVEGLIAR